MSTTAAATRSRPPPAAVTWASCCSSTRRRSCRSRSFTTACCNARASARRAHSPPTASRGPRRASRRSSAPAGADVVAVATNAHEPVLRREWLEAGQHVGSVQTRELDDSVLGRADLIVQRSDLQPTFHFADGHPPVEALDAVEPDAAKTVTLAEVVAGRAGRRSDEEITLFTGGSAGLGTQFAAVAHAVYTSARESGIGRELPTEWFTQAEKP